MNKYTELSDFEINKKVAESLKLNTIAYERTEIVLFDDMDATPFDPCNNPSDAMPIINEYGISLVYKDNQFQFETNDVDIECCITNPLKATMIIFLCMKDADNENNNNG